MPDNEHDDVTSIGVAKVRLINFSPIAKISAPDETNWHVIAEHELEQLASPQSGMFGAIGFAGLGAALGAAPTGCAALQAIRQGRPVPSQDLYSMIILLVCLAVTIICLTAWAYAKHKNKGLSEQIRARPKRYNHSESEQQNG